MYVRQFGDRPPPAWDEAKAPVVDALPEPGHCSRPVAFQDLVGQPLLVGPSRLQLGGRCRLTLIKFPVDRLFCREGPVGRGAFFSFHGVDPRS